MTRAPFTNPAHTATLPPDVAPIGRRPLPDAPPDFLLRLLVGLRRLLLRAADVVVPSEVAVFERSLGAAHTVLLGVVARWRIADVVGDQAFTSDELAARLGANPDALHRAMRSLAHTGVFALRSDGRWVNNRLSHALESGNMMRSRHWVAYWASRSNVDAWMEIDHVLRTGESGFKRAHGESVWAWFDSHPDEREGFAQAMMGLTTQAAGMVASRYPFSEVKTVCDVGGGRGTLLSEILLRHAHLHGTLCENAGLEPLARELFEARGVSERARFEAGSFFEEVYGGAELYVMKNILHDWDDESSRKILATVRRAMKPGAKLLIVENLIGRNEVDHLAALADMQMMMVCDEGRERDVEEFRALFEASGMRLGRVWPGPTDSLIEAVAVGEP